MRAIRRFTVRPVLPEPLTALAELALNLRWCWHADTRELFASIDSQLWARTRHDPIKLLSEVGSDRLTELAGDRRFLRSLELAQADLADYLQADRWYQEWAAGQPDAPRGIGYFSPEFGITEVLPQYSGGLGILAGDHLKAASDLGVPVIGVGLLYRHGYFTQSLNASGWQQERYPMIDPNSLPLRLLRDQSDPARPVVIEVPLDGRTLHAQVWLAQVGRVPLLLLDSDVESNTGSDRDVTDRLYGGGPDHRLAQEILLGIGGVRAIRAYCANTGTPAPQVFHTNEGHAGFLGLERIREFLTGDHDHPVLDFDAALEETRAGTVFTTHTPVPAGIDRFDRDLIRRYFEHYQPLPMDRVLALGAEDYDGGDPGRFNMAVMGFRLAQRANGVSKLHGEVSREMFHGLWRLFDTAEVPITSITNGVHHETWMHPALLEMLESARGDGDTVLDGYDWAGLERVDRQSIWALKRTMRLDLINMARERLAASCRNRGLPSDWTADVLDPDVATFGFARRVPSYKRLTLMLRDPERLKRLLTDPQRPIQIVIAGKSHPDDEGGKALIQQLVQFADQESVRHRIVFLPDYDIGMARPLYPGCDVWMNNPLRPYEACGTSGMKAALNGAANLSIRDGWWDEWYDPAYGWAIPSAEGIDDPSQRDDLEARSLYDMIENEIVMRFYDTDGHGVPQRWVQTMIDTVAGLGPKVLASRMVRDYVEQLYAPAAASSRRLDSSPQAAEKLAVWKRRVRDLWSQVSVDHVESLGGETVQVGSQIEVSALVRLGELRSDEIEVQLITGRVGADDELFDIRTHRITDGVDQTDGVRRYQGVVDTERSGAIGYTVRVVPHHPELASDAELGLAALPAAE
ncbi:glycosyltransferase family 1 protein [Microlunatus elymi]|uniref:glycogen phosphorylase n=1 Tax=Microlunatus elymi TaxID=2596828 RepID=A0A516Q0T1_9ACTN|nr:alpha-glucan family phosphorylase [Microlunatus elymi]QDP97008.1 glycosyltransferase family 1 protein [Microlunatus elymi]